MHLKLMCWSRAVRRSHHDNGACSLLLDFSFSTAREAYSAMTVTRSTREPGDGSANIMAEVKWAGLTKLFVVGPKDVHAAP